MIGYVPCPLGWECLTGSRKHRKGSQSLKKCQNHQKNKSARKQLSMSENLSDIRSDMSVGLSASALDAVAGDEYVDPDDWHLPTEFNIPDYYHSLMSPEEKVDVAYEMINDAARQGFTPLAASVSGSRLRGMDHQESDTDILVVVADDIKRNRSVSSPTQDVDYQIVSLNSYMQTLERSVPFHDFHYSPFKVVRHDYAPLLSSMRPSHYEIETHAMSFVRHLNNRSSVPPEKAFRNSLSIWWMVQNDTPLVPREFFSMTRDNAPREALEWIDDAISWES